MNIDEALQEMVANGGSNTDVSALKTKLNDSGTEGRQRFYNKFGNYSSVKSFDEFEQLFAPQQPMQQQPTQADNEEENKRLDDMSRQMRDNSKYMSFVSEARSERAKAEQEQGKGIVKDGYFAGLAEDEDKDGYSQNDYRAGVKKYEEHRAKVNETAKAVEDRIKALDNQIKTEGRDEADVRRRIKEQTTPSGVWDALVRTSPLGQSIRGIQAIATKDPIIRAKQMLEEAHEMLTAPDKQQGGGFWRSVKNVFADPDTYALGIIGTTQAFRDKDYVEALEQKVVNDQPLTDEEETFYDALILKTGAEMLRAGDISTAYSAGSIAAQSVPFMAEFILTAGVAAGATKGVSTLAQRAFLKYLQRKVAQKATAKVGRSVSKEAVNRVAQSAAKRGVEKLAANRLVSTIGDMTVGAAARMPLMPSSYKTIIEDMTPTAMPDGTFKEGMSFGKAALDAYIEVMSESSGELFGIAKGATVGKLFNFLGQKLGNYSGVKMLDYVRLLGSIVSKGNNALKKAGFHGMLEETGEEIVGETCKYAASIDDEEGWKKFWSKDNFCEMLLGFAPMSVFGLGANAAQAGKVYARYNGSRQEAEEALMDYLGLSQNDAQEWLTFFDNATPDEFESRMDMVYEQAGKDRGYVAKAVTNYMMHKAQKDALSVAWTADEDVSEETQQAIADRTNDLTNRIAKKTNEIAMLDALSNNDASIRPKVEDFINNHEGLTAQRLYEIVSDPETNNDAASAALREEYKHAIAVDTIAAKVDAAVEDRANATNGRYVEVELSNGKFVNVIEGDHTSDDPNTALRFMDADGNITDGTVGQISKVVTDKSYTDVQKEVRTREIEAYDFMQRSPKGTYVTMQHQDGTSTGDVFLVVDYSNNGVVLQGADGQQVQMPMEQASANFKPTFNVGDVLTEDENGSLVITSMHEDGTVGVTNYNPDGTAAAERTMDLQHIMELRNALEQQGLNVPTLQSEDGVQNVRDTFAEAEQMRDNEEDAADTAPENIETNENGSYPTTAEGEPDFGAMDEQTTAGVLTSELGDRAEAAAFAQAKIAEAEKAQKEAEKMKVNSTSLQERKAQIAARNDARDKAQRDIQYWGNVLDRLNAPEEVETPSEEAEEKKESEQKRDKQGNELNEDGTLKVDKINSIDELTDEDFNSPTRSVELPKLPDNVDNAIGANGKPVVIKKNIFEKNRKDHADVTPSQSRDILTAALYSPNLYGQNQKTTRPYNWVVINTKDESGKNRIVLLEVNHNKDNVEIIHWHYVRNSALETIKKQAEREGGQILILPSENSEEVGGLSDLTSEPVSSEETSDTRYTNEEEKGSEKEEKNSEEAAEKKETEEEREQKRLEERKQRILQEGTTFDEYFGLVKVSEDMSAADIVANIQKIISRLREEGDKAKEFNGFAHNGKWAWNAGKQIEGYWQALQGVVPEETLREAANQLGVKTPADLVAYGEKMYKSEEAGNKEPELKGAEKAERDFNEAKTSQEMFNAIEDYKSYGKEVPDEWWKKAFYKQARESAATLDDKQLQATKWHEDKLAQYEEEYKRARNEQKKKIAKANAVNERAILEAYKDELAARQEAKTKAEATEQAATAKLAEDRAKKRDEILKRFEPFVNKGLVQVYTSVDEVPSAQAKAHIRNGNTVHAWYDVDNNVVCVYLPHINDAQQAEEMMWHEVVAHMGLRELAQKLTPSDKQAAEHLFDAVWNGMNDEARKVMTDYIRQSLPALWAKVKNRATTKLKMTGKSASAENVKAAMMDDKELQRAAADEYAAHLAERLANNEQLTEQEQSIVEKIFDALRKLIAKLAGVQNVALKDNDIVRLLVASRKNIEASHKEAESTEETKPTESEEKMLKNLTPEENAEFNKIRAEIDDLTDKWDEQIENYIAENYPETLVVSNQSKEERAKQWEARKKDKKLADMRRKKDEELKPLNERYHDLVMEDALMAREAENKEAKQKAETTEAKAEEETEEEWPVELFTDADTVELGFNYIKAHQDIKPVESKAKFNADDYAAKDELRPIIGGVYHDADAKMGVVTDAHVLVASKQLYDSKKKGKVIATHDIKPDERFAGAKKGEAIKGEYPNWRSVLVSKNPDAVRQKVDFDKMADMVAGIIESERELWQIAKERQKENPHEYFHKVGNFKDYIQETMVYVRMEDGRIQCFKLPVLQKFVTAAKMIGAKEMILYPNGLDRWGKGSETRAIGAISKDGEVICMPAKPLTWGSDMRRDFENSMGGDRDRIAGVIDLAEGGERFSVAKKNQTPKNTTLDEVLFSIRVNHNTPYLLKRADGSFVDPETGERLGFDHRFMGTGEGAQVHGWGSYFSVKDIRAYAGDKSIKVMYKGELLADKIQWGAFLELTREGLNIAKAVESLERKAAQVKESFLPADRKEELAKQTLSAAEELKKLDQKQLDTDNDRHHYVVDIPDNDGTNYFEEDKIPTDEQMNRIYDGLKERRVPQEYIDSLKKGFHWKDNRNFRYVYHRLSDILLPTANNYKQASQFLSKLGFAGIHYNGLRDGECYVIFDENDAQIVAHERFSIANANQAVFVSNAARAVEGIKQDKATPAQWLAMIEKQGGLKAGEDKWLGLSEWLNDSKSKILTKQEVLDFVNENKIQIEEVKYDNVSDPNNPELKRFQDELDEAKNEIDARYEEADKAYGEFMDSMQEKYGDDWSENMTEDEYATESRLINNRAQYDVDSDANRTAAAFEILTERYGDDFEMAFELGWNNKLAVSDPNAAAYFFGTDNSINDTRLEYTTKGLDNKREIALTVPTIDSWNESDEIHFGDAGEGRAVAWARFGDTTDSEGKRVLVIDEIQSKRHQEGREKGYEHENPIEGLHISEYKPTHVKEYADKISFANVLMHDDIPIGYIEKTEDKYRPLDTQGQYIGFTDFATEEEALNAVRKRYATVEGVPDAPFEKNWHELAMKRMLRLAAEEGYDKVAWTTGAQQADRYYIGGVVENIQHYKYKGNTHVMVNLKNNNEVVCDVDNNGIVVRGDNHGFIKEGQPLSDLVGKSLADAIINGEGEAVNPKWNAEGADHVDVKELSGDDLRIGGEGMKGFYDKMLPSFVSKYVKKWGAKVGEVELPKVEEAGRRMWSVDVTPEMRESVMEGQVMFSIGTHTFNNGKSLIGLHNIDSGSLRKALKTGGLANPSVAIIDIATQNHHKYGEISLILPSSMVDSRTGRNDGTYLGDAYTPTYPHVERQKGKDTPKRLDKLVEGLPQNLGRFIKQEIQSYMDGNTYYSGLEYLYLKERGEEVPIAHTERDYPHISTKEIAARLGKEGETDSQVLYEAYSKLEGKDLYDFNLWLNKNGDTAKIEDFTQRAESVDSELIAILTKKYKEHLPFGSFDMLYYRIFGDERDAGTENLNQTLENAALEIDKRDLRKDFEAWKAKTIDSLGYEEVLFAGYTPSGYRRYLPNTVENASKLMNKEPKTNATNMTALGATRAMLADKLRTLDAIRKHRDMLKPKDEEIEKIYDEVSDEWYELGRELADNAESKGLRTNSNDFFEVDSVLKKLQEAMQKSNPTDYLNKEYGYSLPADGEMAQRIKDMKARIKNLPTAYFETWFRRPVYLREFAAAVVPSDLSQDLKDSLSGSGLPLYEYEDNNEESRREATLKATEGENVRFSMRNKTRKESNNAVDKAVSYFTGRPIKEVRSERQREEKERKELAQEIYDNILNLDFSPVSLQKINKYLSDATPRNRYGRLISHRLPQRVERTLYADQQGSGINALVSRVSERAVAPADRKSAEGRGRIAQKKQEILKAYAQATNQWYENLSDIPNIDASILVDSGKDAEIYSTTDGAKVIKLKYGKQGNQRFPQDIDDIALFNNVFPSLAYDIIGYGNFERGFATIVTQPTVRISDDNVSREERVAFMQKSGFEPINKEATAFSNGEIIASDIQKKNIVKDNKGDIRVIDADMKLHLKSEGGEYTYPPVEEDIRFSAVTPAEDAAYMEAVERGDMETAQRMVNEAAAKAGYDSNTDYQGSVAFNGAAPSANGYYETKEERKEAFDNGELEGEQSLGDYIDNGIDRWDLDWQLKNPIAASGRDQATLASIRNLNYAIRNGNGKIKMYRAVDADIKENSFRNGDWVTPSRQYATEHIGLQAWKRGRIIEQEVSVDDIWWDGNDINEWGYDDGKGYAYKNTKNNRKLLDAVTYDDEGKVIPLSKRFNSRKDDVRFSVSANTPTTPEDDEEYVEPELPVYDPKTMSILDYLDVLKAYNAERLKIEPDKAAELTRREMRNALLRQKKEIRDTVAILTKIANTMLADRGLGDVNKGAVQRTLAAIKNAATKRDLEEPMNTLYDIAIKRQLSQMKARFERILKLPTKKVNSNKVSMAKAIDDKARVIIETFKNWYKAKEDDIKNKLNENTDKIANDADLSALARETMENENLALGMCLSYQAEVDMARQALREIRDAEREVEENPALAADDKAAQLAALAAQRRLMQENLVESYEHVCDVLANIYVNGHDDYIDEQKRIEDHKHEVLHYAFSDLQGIVPNTNAKQQNQIERMMDFILNPNRTFLTELKKWARYAPNGEGYLFNHFARGFIDARHTHITGLWDAQEKLAAACERILGKGMNFTKAVKATKKVVANANFKFGDNEGTMPLTIGKIMMIYAWNKQADGKVKLRAMEVSEADVEQWADMIPHEYIELMDWIQDEFLPKLRDKYNNTHRRVFGTQMAFVENYFPIKIAKEAIARKEDVEAQPFDKFVSAIVSGIKNRSFNKKTLDVMNNDALTILADHIKEMEWFNAMSGIAQDLNTLVGSSTFNNKIDATFLGKASSRRLSHELSKILLGKYQDDSAGESVGSSLIKMVARSKISGRLWTAIKQLASFPAFLVDSAAVKTILKDVVDKPTLGVTSVRWCFENLPMLKERFASRLAGNAQLDTSALDNWAFFRKVNELSQLGLLPNGAVDFYTCSIGAYAKYRGAKKRYLSYGLSEADAEKRAIQDAEIFYNETQQSSEGLFRSQMQASRTVFNVAMSAFQNAQFGYGRKFVDGCRQVVRALGHKQDMLAFAEKQWVRSGLTEEQAKKAAKRDYNRSLIQGIANIAMFGFVIQAAWYVFGHAPQLVGYIFGIGGDDDDEKADKDKAIEILMNDIEQAYTTPVIGLRGGAQLDAFWQAMINDTEFDLNAANKDILISDLVETVRKASKGLVTDDWAMFTNAVVRFASSFTGTDIQTLYSIIEPAVELSVKDDIPASEIYLDIMRILNMPNSQQKAIGFRHDPNRDIVRDYVDWKRKQRYGVFYHVFDQYYGKDSEGWDKLSMPRHQAIRQELENAKKDLGMTESETRQRNSGTWEENQAKKKAAGKK